MLRTCKIACTTRTAPIPIVIATANLRASRMEDAVRDPAIVLRWRHLALRMRAVPPAQWLVRTAARSPVTASQPQVQWPQPLPLAQDVEQYLRSRSMTKRSTTSHVHPGWAHVFLLVMGANACSNRAIGSSSDAGSHGKKVYCIPK